MDEAIKLACCSMPLAILLGILVAVARMYGPWPIKAILTAYVEVLRGTPLLLQMYVWFFLVPSICVSAHHRRRTTWLQWFLGRSVLCRRLRPRDQLLRCRSGELSGRFASDPEGADLESGAASASACRR